ncbi:protein Barley B recombinant-like [Chenopodium quinoa]|uniref:protein Barley B recombinant-like n=1 Tax=Chenopodium quinoa TaxID=63459 RepID=UPI000B78A4B6|nr:protein Barley B recombinant-like [Chenopodium quinoa]
MESLHNEPSLYPTKQIKNSRRKTYHLQNHPHQYQHQHQAAQLPNILRQSSCGAIPHKYALPPPHVQLEMVHALAGGVFLNHFPNHYSHSSFPPTLSAYHHQKIHQQPPLLPLPVVSKPAFRSLPPPPLTRNHSLPYSLPKKQPNKTKLNSSKKSTTPTKNPKKEVADKSKATTKGIMKNGSSSLVENDQPSVGPAKGVKPGPVSTPKEASRVLKAVNHKNGIVNEKEKYFSKASASVFTISPESPPPSSLPLPKFPLRKLQQSKLSCTAEAAAAEVDPGATDNLCRMLKLR